MKEMDSFRYLVLKTLDIQEALSDEDLDTLNILIDKVRQYRVNTCRKAYPKYVVVSEVLECYNDVKLMVLEELNESK